MANKTSNKYKDKEEKLRNLSYMDPLTDLANRRHFDECFTREWLQGQRKKQQIAFIMIDIDFFKKVNDNYGHQVGDMVLVKLVTLMREQVRSSDIVARYGGEEFAIILPDTGIHIAHEVAERIRHEVENQKLSFNDQTLGVTVSIGLASLSQITHQMGALKKGQDGLDKLLLGKADEALYQAKQTGRNQVVIKRMAN